MPRASGTDPANLKLEKQSLQRGVRGRLRKRSSGFVEPGRRRDSIFNPIGTCVADALTERELEPIGATALIEATQTEVLAALESALELHPDCRG